MTTAADKVWDIIIVGGGLGGLSLAVELAAPEFAHLRVLVLEKRSAYTRDRTWSYWASAPHRYTHLERQRWKQWSVALGNTTHTHESAQHSYATIDADAFYNHAQACIQVAPHVQLQMDCGAAKIDAATRTVTTTQGQVLRARTLLDARPATQLAPGTLVQQFVGWEVTTQHNAFNASTVQLMMFEPHDRGLHFWYVLPYSARCALVESTWVSPASWQPDDTQELKAYIAKLCGPQPYSVAYQEQGVLNLQAAAPAPASTANPVPGLGRNGGTLRGATGYAFLDTVAHAAALAGSLAQLLQQAPTDQWQPPAFERPAMDRWMDAVFLDVLRSNWRAAPGYFMQIFDQLPAQDTVAFLTGRASWAQRWAMMRSLPVKPFASAAVARQWGHN